MFGGFLPNWEEMQIKKIKRIKGMEEGKRLKKVEYRYPLLPEGGEINEGEVEMVRAPP